MSDEEPIIGGLFLSQLDWLCHPTRLDNTMRLLWLVNLWAKARNHLYYADRQGLYQVKGAILSHAYRKGAIQPIAYVDGTALAFQDLSLDVAASCAADALHNGLLDLFWIPPNRAKLNCPLCGAGNLAAGTDRLTHWQGTHINHPYLKLSWSGWVLGMDKSEARNRLPEADYRDHEANIRYWHIDSIGRMVQAQAINTQHRLTSLSPEDQRVIHLYRQIMGESVSSKAEVDTLPLKLVETYIFEQLQTLTIQALNSRRPIPIEALKALCIYPSDILETIKVDWEDLDAGDLRKLDPEGLSLVGFRYTSENTQLVFLMPYRIAEAFLELDMLELLRLSPTEIREEGQFYGRAITDDERQQHPIVEVLMDLGVDIDAVCPKGLVDKQVDQTERYQRYLTHRDEYDDGGDEEDDDDWELAVSTEWLVGDVKGCPLCSTEIFQPHLRLQHWHEEHSAYTVLTSGQAAWILNQNAYAIKSQFVCDFTAYINNNPTRLWLLSTLERIYQQMSLE